MSQTTKVLTAIGTRPDAIRLAPVVRQLQQRPGCFTSSVCVAGPHGDIVRPILDLLDIGVEHELEVTRRSPSLTDVTVRVLERMDTVIAAERPDWVLVQGDTTSAMATALAAFHHMVPVGHVEAGLRTRDVHDAFPEELNRRVAGVVSTLHFAPTDWAADNLRREGIADDRIHVTGHTVIDCFQHVGTLPLELSPALAAVPFEERRVIVVTCHRRESLGRPIEDTCWALRALARAHEDAHIVFPVPADPRVQQPAAFFLGGLDNVTLLPPLEYPELVYALKHCHLLITDSGGLQEEATSVGTPVLVTRSTIDRPEGVHAGTARLVGPDQRAIEAWGRRLLTDDGAYREMSRATSPFGTGRAAHRIADLLAAVADPGRAAAVAGPEAGEAARVVA